MGGKFRFTAREKLLTASGLAIAILGLLNWVTWQLTLFGLSFKQVAMVSFVPLIVIEYFILNRPVSRSAE